MPKIDFNFSGFINGANITKVVCSDTFELINVENMDSKELVDGLNSGKYLIGLIDYLQDNDDEEIVISDFQESI